MSKKINVILFAVLFLLCGAAFAQTSSAPTIAYGNDWVATDALGRTLPDYASAGGTRGQRYIGMFYWLWHPYVRLKDGPQTTTAQLIHDNPNSPAFECNDRYWGEPENGFYHPEDPWSTRRNLQLLANAGVDFIYIDFTNGSQGCDAINSFMNVMLDMYNKGIPAPKIVFFLNEGGVDDAVNCIMDKVYNNQAYQPLWFYWQGKPLIMADPAKTASLSTRANTSQVQNFFTWRKTWAFDAGEWNFLDDYPQDYYSFNGVAEQMPVSKAMGAPINADDQGSSHLTGGPMPNYDQYWETPTSGQGLRFEQNWSRAHQVDPQIVCVSGWNELIAAAWPSRADNSNVSCMGKQWNDPSWRCVNQASCISKDANGNHLAHGWYYVDEFNTEFNRDLEPMKGGYTDNYYYQLVSHIRQHKGLAAPQPVSAAKTIAMDGQFGEWSSVTPVQKDATGDCQHRNFQDVKNSQTYVNNSGRNDVIESRTTADGANVYFYIKTASAITAYTDPNWMLVYLNTDKDKSTGWEGFDYVVNMGVTNASQTTIKKRVGNSWVAAGTATYSVSGSEMEISVSRDVLGLTSNTISYYYQIFDNPSALDNIEDNFVNGESAPDRRFNYSVTIPTNFLANVNYWHFVSDMEGWNLLNNLTPSVSNSIATMNITGGDPYMHSPDNLNLSTSDYKYIVVRMQNVTTDNTAELFWTTTTSPGYDGTKHVTFPITPNDAAQQYYIIDLSANPDWNGIIKQIRLDPSSSATSGSSKIDLIKFVGTYTAVTQIIPGKIEIENFDKGGQGNAYNDSDVLNNGSEYRVTEGVDIQTTTDVGGGYNVGWTDTGEWMEYLVDVQQSGNYTITLRAAAVAVAGVHIEIDGIQIGNTFSIPVTTTYQTFVDVSITGTLSQGKHLLKIVEETGNLNLNNILFVKQNQAPTVSITAPSNNAVYTSSASVTITANANDADGSISKVEFYNGSTLLTSDATAPYSYSWTNVATGTYAITAKAYDNVNAVTTSTAVTLQVNAPNQLPTVSITAPSSNAVYTSPASVTITANANDADGAISKVEFYNGGTLLTSDATAPYSYSWTNVGAGAYTITAKAYDNVSGVTTSAAVSIQVNTPANQIPTVSITAPSNNAVYTSPASVTITANANDADGAISKVEFYNGGTLLNSDNTAPYSYAWTNIAAGTYMITAKAYDNVNASTMSLAVTIQVNVPPVNQLPSVSITTPTNNAVYTSPANVAITANANDADGTISKVEFYNGSTLLTSDATAPYSCSWTNVGAGAYTITARAYDNVNASTTSAAVTIQVNTPPNQVPTVTITAPLNNAVYNTLASVTITANANDADGSVSKVEFYNGATLLGADNTAPYSYIWSNIGVGTYTITAKVYDNVNESTISVAVEIEVEASVPTSTNGASNALGIVAAPTPFQTTTTIRMSGSDEIQSVAIYNAIGQEVQRIENVSASEVVIGEALSDGMYLVYVTTTNGTTTMKVLKGN